MAVTAHYLTSEGNQAFRFFEDFIDACEFVIDRREDDIIHAHFRATANYYFVVEIGDGELEHYDFAACEHILLAAYRSGVMDMRKAINNK